MNKIGPGIEDYVATRILPDGRIIGAHRLMYHWTMHIDISEWGYEDRYCYMHLDDLLADLDSWDGKGDPPGKWHKHPKTDRYRDVVTGQIWTSNEIAPEGATIFR